MKHDVARGEDSARVVVLSPGQDIIRVSTVWTCEKWSEEACSFVRRKLGLLLPVVSSDLLKRYVGNAEEILVVPGNLLLNEGIQEVWDLVIAAGGTTAYNNANADIGVGDSNTAAVATQTDLQAGANKLFKAMNAGKPARTNQTMNFASDFGSSEANFAWQEWSIRNGNTRNKNLNRKVESLGTKSTGTWTLSADVTLS